MKIVSFYLNKQKNLEYKKEIISKSLPEKTSEYKQTRNWAFQSLSLPP